MGFSALTISADTHLHVNVCYRADIFDYDELVDSGMLYVRPEQMDERGNLLYISWRGCMTLPESVIPTDANLYLKDVRNGTLERTPKQSVGGSVDCTCFKDAPRSIKAVP